MLWSVALSARAWQHAGEHLFYPLPAAVTQLTTEMLDTLLADS